MFHLELQPHLIGELIELRPLLPADFEALYQCASDPLIWEQHPQADRYQREVFQTYFDGAIDSLGAFAVIDKVSGKIIGSSRFYNADPEKNQITIGYTFLARPYWGRKFNREMKQLLLDHAFQTFETVLFEVGEFNIRSQQALGKIGATLIDKKTLDEKTHLIFSIKRDSLK